MSIRNYHTHTHFCKHGTGTVSDYCEAALALGMDVIAITDHCPYPDGRWIGVRMELDLLPLYMKEFEVAKAKYPQLKIVAGVECEYDKEMVQFQKDTFLGLCGFKCIAGAIHSFKHHGEWRHSFLTAMDVPELHSYTDYLIESMDSGVFTFLAHPDLFGVGHRGWDADCDACSRAIVQAAIQHNLPLEINANGIRKGYIDDGGTKRWQYPWRPFWEIAGEYGAKVLCNSDAHTPGELWGKVDESLSFAKELGLDVINDSFYEDYIL